MKAGRLLIVISLLAAAAQSAFYWARLPAMMASHFGAAGQANGWQSKPAFFGFYCFIMLLLAVIFLGMPVLIRFMPVSLINLPNKDYWLAPQRREASLSFLQNQLELTGAAAMLLVVLVMQLAMNANLNGSASLSPVATWLLLIVFVGFELMCTARMITRFGARPVSG
jgi:uncharacterized membrane protein